MTEYLLPENEQYKFEGGWIEMFGMENFMKPGSADYEKLRGLAYEYKTIDGYEEGKGYIVRQGPVIDAKKYGDIYYTLEEPKELDQDLPNKLLVWFAPFHEHTDLQAELRMFSRKENRWPSLMKHVASNTYILRLPDVGLHSGSFFQNTVLFQEYERQIQDLIQSIASIYKISHDRTVLYGASRGGTGAFIHGLIGRYKTVAIDPIMQSKLYDEKGLDLYLNFDFLPENFVGRLNELLDGSTQNADQIKIISASNLVNYTYLKALHLERFDLLNLDYRIYEPYDKDKAHGIFTTGTFPLALQYINSFLYQDDIKVEKTPIKINFSSWDVELPTTSRGFIFHIKDEGLEVTRTGYEADPDDRFRLKFKSKILFSTGKKYKVSIKVISSSTLSSIFVDSKEFYPRKDAQTYVYEVQVDKDSSEMKLYPETYQSGWNVEMLNVVIEEI